MDHSQTTDTITLSSSDYLQTTDTITLSSSDIYTTSMTAPVTLGGIGAIGTNFPNTIYTTANAATGNVPWPTQSPFSAPKIQLNGEGADVEVNGWSLVQAVKSIEQRLAILQPRPDLEEEWAELKVLGDRYRELEAKCLEKAKMWEQLKS
jgi:hypothetical protein